MILVDRVYIYAGVRACLRSSEMDIYFSLATSGCWNQGQKSSKQAQIQREVNHHFLFQFFNISIMFEKHFLLKQSSNNSLVSYSISKMIIINNKKVLYMLDTNFAAPVCHGVRVKFISRVYLICIG